MPQKSHSLKYRIVGTTLAASLTFGFAAAQDDGTAGTAPETPEACTLVASEFVAAPSASPVASPVAATPVIATPVVATPVSATPVASADPREEDLQTGIDTILRCMSKNDAANLMQVTSPEFRSNWIGLGESIDDPTFESLLSMMPRLPYALVSVENVSFNGDTATATVVYTVGRQAHTEDWQLSLNTADGMQVWKVDSATAKATTAPENATTIKLQITDEGFTFDPATVPTGPVVIEVTNTGSNPHEALILRVPADVSAADIAAAPTGIPEGVTFIGQATIPAGESGTIVLLDVRPGTYTVVDLLPDAAGLPGISNGMITTFEVTEP